LRSVRAINCTRNVVLAERAAVADSFRRRGWGLLGRSSLQPGEGMVITETNCIHSMFMRFPFDAVYLRADGVACRVLAELPPFRCGPLIWRAKHVLELPAGTIARTGTVLGDVIVFQPAAGVAQPR